MDTGAWIAGFHRRDRYHAEAAAHFRLLRERRTELLVTDLILAEVHVHLVRGFGPRVAAEHLAAVKSDPLVTEVFADPDLQAAALDEWIDRYRDQPFTFTDAVSFAVMRARRMREAFSFDRHFEAAGFRRLPALRG